MSSVRTSIALASLLALSAPAFADGGINVERVGTPAFKQARSEFRATMHAHPKLWVAHVARALGFYGSRWGAMTGVIGGGPMLMSAAAFPVATPVIGAGSAVIAGAMALGPTVFDSVDRAMDLAPLRYRTVAQGVKQGLIPAAKMKSWQRAGLIGSNGASSRGLLTW